ncbi:c-type cytochrome [Nitratifractor sp.]
MGAERLFLTLLTAGLLVLPIQVQAKPRGKHVVKEKVGQQYYLRACAPCHGPGKIGGNMATQSEWKALLSEHAKELAELHEGERNTTAVIDYLRGPRFEKEHDRLLKFLQEFANDSESIPTCY